MRAESNRVMGGGPVAGRLIFANQLRGLAALSVAFSHLVGVFWLMRSFVGLATFSPVQPGSPPKLVDMVSAAWFQPGPFGVAVFFLISGLVLPISLGQHSRSSFLLARLLRIYPTYLLALVIEVAVLHAAAVYWNTPFGYGNWTIAANGLLIHDLLDLPSVDLVNWTLCVELKFYLLLALLAPRIRRGDVSCLFVVALAVVASNSAFSWLRIDATPLAQMLSTESVCIVFMLLGVLFNFRLRRLLSERSFLIAIFAMFALFVAAWRNGPVGNQFPLVTVNYAYALALFAILYGLRRYVREGRFLNFAAAISFPLYLVHSIIGFVVMKLLMLSYDIAYPQALACALVVIALIATGLHVSVERPAIAIGKRLAGAKTPLWMRARELARERTAN